MSIWGNQLAGPTDPATHTSSPAACRASRAPARLYACTWSPRPWRSRQKLFAPKVLVVMTCAPHAT